jgi:tetratricopeptide (TPR) repeat protein
MLILIWRSQSRQGLVAFSIGVAIILVVVLGKRKLIFGVISAVVFGSLFILAVLGMLQIGPLTSLLYKESVSIRGFYWRAAFEMFLHNPFNGVGIDKYGSFFKEFREIQYPLNYGFNLTSTNAHNVYLQLLATGGLIVALPYIALKAYITISGIKYILRNSGKELILFIGLFACWIAYEAQSIISIDNIGLTIWGWLLAGAILAISRDKKDLTPEKQPKFIASFKRSDLNLISYFMIIPALIFALFFTKGESEMWKARLIGESTGFQPSEELKTQTLKAMQTPFLDPMWKIICADYFAQMGNFALGANIIEEILQNDSRNLDALQVGTKIYAADNKTELAIKLQIRISEIDPYNAENYYVLLKNYMLLGDLGKAQIMLEKIKQVAPNSEEFRLATEELAIQEK